MLVLLGLDFLVIQTKYIKY